MPNLGGLNSPSSDRFRLIAYRSMDVSSQTLVVTPSTPLGIDGSRLFLDIKAVNGLKRYAALWPGRVRCLMRLGDRSHIAFGESYDRAELPFDIVPVERTIRDHADALNDAAILLASGDSHLDLELPDIVATPTVFVIEYTLETRLRILRLDHSLSIQTAKSAAWLLLRERDRRRAFGKAVGLQANGTPAFDSYRTLTPSSICYFDTRMTNAQQITNAEIQEKIAQVRAGRPLRLAFSGRLAKMKGADHLIPFAVALKGKGTAFTLDIYGDGPLHTDLQDAVQGAGLRDLVRLNGPIPFDTGLVPKMKNSIDLFVCCHRQADPSCTYMETLSCGVPIVGYDNAAFKGIAALGNVGVTVPIDNINALATATASLADDRDRLVEMMRAAAQISQHHSFESIFSQRVNHLRTIAQV